jgi:hypothetical protein
LTLTVYIDRRFCQFQFAVRFIIGRPKAAAIVVCQESDQNGLMMAMAKICVSNLTPWNYGEMGSFVQIIISLPFSFPAGAEFLPGVDRKV